MAPYLAIALCALAAYGVILVNGAGFSHPDDHAAAGLACCDFRPLLSETYALNRRFGGWMATNLFLHLLAGFALFGLSGSLGAACLFVAHPMAADAVASVSGRSAVLFALVTLLVLLFWRRTWLAGIGIGVTVLAILGGIPGRIWPIPGAPDLSRHLFAYLSAMVTYIGPRLVLPIHLSADPEIHSHVWSATLGLMLLSAMVGALILVTRPYRLALGLILLGLVPYLVIPLPDVFLEHRGYLALAGAAVLLAKLAPRPVLLAAIGLFIALSHARAQVYATPEALWSDAAQQAPKAFRPHLNAGAVHGMALHFPDAERELRTALQIDDREIAWRALTAVYIAQNKIREASQLLALHSKEGY